MRTIVELLAAADGLSPQRLKSWYNRLPAEEKLQLDAIRSYWEDARSPRPVIGASGLSELPGLNYYDRRSEGFVCTRSRRKVRIVGKDE